MKANHKKTTASSENFNCLQASKKTNHPCHRGNGWIYGLVVIMTGCKVFRYHTNGSVNSNYEYSKVFELKEMTRELGQKRIDLIKEEGKDAGQLERVFFNGIPKNNVK